MEGSGRGFVNWREMMKVAGKVLVLIIVSSIGAASAGWEREPTYEWAYAGEWEDLERVVFVLHGAGPRPEDIDRTDFDSFLADRSLVVLPRSGIVPTPQGDMYAWDSTGYLTVNREVQQLIDLLLLARDLFHKPIYLIGGSSGSLMAYKVYSELVRIGREGLIDALVLMDGTSPYAIEAYGQEAPAYIGQDTIEVHHLLGWIYVRPEVCPEDHTYLGLNNPYIRLKTPILVIYSSKDTVVIDEIKEEFADALERTGDNVEVKVIGTNHAIGKPGWKYIKQWLKRVY